MSELSFSSKNSNFSSIDLLADFFHVCFFILSHPLYFSYFIFFSPYLLKLLSFLSPLFITTTLLVLAYLSVSPNSTSDFPKIKVGTCYHTYQTVIAKLQYPKVDHSNGDDDHEEFRSFEEFEVYKIVFDTSSLEVRESPVAEMSSEEVSDAPIDQSYSLEGHGSIGYFLEAASEILEEIRNNPVEEMSSEQALDAPIDESSSLEGDSNTGLFLEGAIWEEQEENPDEQKSSTQVFDAAFDERSSPESSASDSSGYFSEASSAAVDQNPVERKRSSQVSDAPTDGKSSPEGNDSASYFFEASSADLEESRENLVEKQCSSQVSDEPIDKNSSLEGKGSTGNVLEAASVILVQKAVEEEKEVKPLSAYFDKVEDGESKRLVRRESKDRDLGANDGGLRSKSMVINSQFQGSNLGSAAVKAMGDSQVMGPNPNLGSFGSMRKEKEWRRTLACKLFEERHHNVDGGGEGMDMLWETYDETESGKALQGIKSKSKKQGKKTNKVDHKEVDDVDEEEEDEELDNSQLCCLQALKLSAGKMNLGHVGRPNLVKITKALKGFGWLHHVSKHNKKGYH